MSNNKVGVGLAGGLNVLLYVEVLSRDKDRIDFNVINGGWHGELRADGTLVAYESPRRSSEYKGYAVLFDGPCSGRDYNEVIDNMNGKLLIDAEHAKAHR